MTCIAGLVHKNQVHIGGDSAGIARLSLTVRADNKVFRIGDFVFGFAGSFRAGQLIRHAFKPPEGNRSNLENYLCVDFINALRTCLKDGGFASKENETESGSNFLLGVDGRLFRVADDYQVGEALDGYDAIGCGDEIALGSLYTTKGKKPRDRLETALAAAERHSAGVRGPFSFVSTV